MRHSLIIVMLALALAGALAQGTGTPSATPPAATEPVPAAAAGTTPTAQTAPATGKDNFLQFSQQETSATDPNNTEANTVLNLPDSTVQAEQPKSPLAQAMSVLLNLCLVLALAYGALVLLKRHQQGKLKLPVLSAVGINPPARTLQVVETVSLGQGRSLHLVAIEGRRFLIGSTPQQVALLEEIAGAPPAEAAADEEDQAFAAMLARYLPDKAANSGTPPSPGVTR